MYRHHVVWCQVGSQVSKFKVGDRVTISAVVACGRCEYCQAEKFSLCDTTNPSKEMETQYGHRLGMFLACSEGVVCTDAACAAGVFGYTHLTGGYEGTQAEYCRVPMADVNLLKLPEGVPDDKAVFLSDVCCTGWHANELAEVGSGDVVAIWGAGPIGLMTGYVSARCDWTLV
jgi:threonine dehydrogenase-like Zn-dependent dehydrogenase